MPHTLDPVGPFLDPIPPFGDSMGPVGPLLPPVAQIRRHSLNGTIVDFELCLMVCANVCPCVLTF